MESSDFTKIREQTYQRIVKISMWWTVKGVLQDYQHGLSTEILLSKWMKIKEGEKYISTYSEGPLTSRERSIYLFYFNYGNPNSLIIKTGYFKNEKVDEFISEIMKKNELSDIEDEFKSENLHQNYISKLKDSIINEYNSRTTKKILTLENDMEIKYVGKLSDIKEILTDKDCQEGEKENVLYSCKYLQKVDKNLKRPRITFMGEDVDIPDVTRTIYD